MYEVSGKSKLFLDFWEAEKNEHNHRYVSLFLVKQKRKEQGLALKIMFDLILWIQPVEIKISFALNHSFSRLCSFMLKTETL